MAACKTWTTIWLMLTMGWSMALASGDVRAEQARGPTLQIERADNEPSHSNYRSVRRTRARLNGVIPLVTQDEGSNLYVSLDVMRETRRHRAADSSVTTDNMVASEGLLYMYKLPHETLVPLIWVSTFQAPGVRSEINHMDQVMFGLQSRHKIPLFGGYRGRTTVGYRLRWYPSHKNYLLYVSEEVFSDTFWQFYVSTAGGRLDFYTPDQDLWGYIGYEGDSRDYFGQWINQEVWMIGWAVTGYVGVRHRIAGILYGAFDVGLQSEGMRYNTGGDDMLIKYQTHYTPWFRVAVETWVDVK